MAPRKGRKGKQATSKAVEQKPAAAPTPTDAIPPPVPENEPPKEPPLVLTSDKPRGIYECDYCHADISQMPRIRCAVCPDFDLCLDCFSSADHKTAIASLKAVQNATNVKVPDHNASHGYRVADSTRYVLFPPPVAVAPSRPSSVIDGNEGQPKSGGDEDVEMKEPDESAPTEETKVGNDGSKDVTMEEAASASDAEQRDKSGDESQSESVLVVQEDPKITWTVEEDLRLLDAIKTCGLGNWADISEAIAGQGSSNKTPKRCQQRYLDDFLGRYGQIIPPYMVVEVDEEDEGEDEEKDGKNEEGTEDDPSPPGSKVRSISVIEIDCREHEVLFLTFRSSFSTSTASTQLYA